MSFNCPGTWSGSPLAAALNWAGLLSLHPLPSPNLAHLSLPACRPTLALWMELLSFLPQIVSFPTLSSSSPILLPGLLLRQRRPSQILGLPASEALFYYSDLCLPFSSRSSYRSLTLSCPFICSVSQHSLSSYYMPGIGLNPLPQNVLVSLLMNQFLIL